MINCKLNLCVFNKGEKCVLESISIDERGNCENCQLISISIKYIEEAKQTIIKKLEKTYRAKM
ncbi:MAG: DUF1540 domain-containing protein [Firmicutes bacterium]|nr:DUF1540 domain-containing protein [Bacillota bacterium]